VCESMFSFLFSILLLRLAFTLALYAVLAVLNALGFCYLFLFCFFTHCAHRRGRAGGGQTAGARMACWCQQNSDEAGGKIQVGAGQVAADWRRVLVVCRRAGGSVVAGGRFGGGDWVVGWQ